MTDYPRAAALRREQGTALIRVVVAPDGRAAEVAVERSSGSLTLDAAARAKILRDCRFVPATRDGVPVTGEALQPMTFTLDQP